MRTTTQPRLHTVPITLAEAKAYVGVFHRNHPEGVTGHRWSLGIADEADHLRGVAVCGRPKAIGFNGRPMLEVNRVATDGTPNACSALYGAAARSAVAMGYERHNVITYTLLSESGTSLIAAGWVRDGVTKGGSWDTPSRRRTDKASTEPKVRWRAAPLPRPSSGQGEP